MSILEIRGLTKNFGGLVAVSNLDMVVDEGEIVALIGPNGAGKTTAFNLISGVFPPTRGKVIFKGEDITKLKPYEVAKKGISRTFQLTTLFGEMTVLENVTAGYHLSVRAGFWRGILNTPFTRNEERQLAEEVMDLLGFLGLMEVKDMQAKNLPHGHQRALGFAMALATKADLIMLDEPVTGMTPEETTTMMERIKQIQAQRGQTILLVEHDMRAVMAISDRIYALNFGKKIAEGSPEEISQNEEVIKAYLGERRGRHVS